jgi:hypothetical protein
MGGGSAQQQQALGGLRSHAIAAAPSPGEWAASGVNASYTSPNDGGMMYGAMPAGIEQQHQHQQHQQQQHPTDALVAAAYAQQQQQQQQQQLGLRSFPAALSGTPSPEPAAYGAHDMLRQHHQHQQQRAARTAGAPARACRRTGLLPPGQRQLR